MSHIPFAPTPLAERLAARAAQYCTRANTLSDAPDLTVGCAARALDHLAALQRELANERLRQCRALMADLAQVEAQFKPHEAALMEARVTLSSALMRAEQDQHEHFGLVPHGYDTPDVVADDGGDGTSTPPTPAPKASIRAVSACRALLDLETLRPYLSDDALRQAMDQHARATDCHNLQGVAYAALPRGAHLPCEVL